MFREASILHEEGFLDQAESLYLRCLHIDPLHFEALQAIGRLYVQLGKCEQALPFLRQAASIDAKHSGVQLSLGLALVDSDPEQALIHFQSSIPSPDAYRSMAHVLYMLNREEEGRNILSTLVQIDPQICMELALRWKENQYPWAREGFLVMLQAQGDSLQLLLLCAQFFIDEQELAQALPFLEKACVLHPEMREAHILIGDIYHQSKEYSQALQAYEQALALDPEHHEAYAKLAMTAIAIGKTSIAKELCARSLERNPLQAHVCYLCATFHYDDGELHLAQKLLEQAVSIDPSHLYAGYRLAQHLFSSIPPQYDEAEKVVRSSLIFHPEDSSLLNMMGHICFVRGDQAAALSYYQHVVRVNPNHGSAYHQLARYSPEPLIDKIPIWKDILKDGGMKDDQRSHLAFALGSTLDRIGEVDEAFSYFALANEIERRHRVYSLTDIQVYLHQQRSQFAHLMPPPLKEDVRHVFIVGMMRSGSTLLEQLLCAHPDVYSVGEIPRIPQLASAHNPLDVSSIADEIRDEYDKTIRQYANLRPVVLDKLLGNFAYLGWIRHAFPDARVLHCVRDPIDTCWSIYRHRFVGNHPYAYALDELGRYYSTYQTMMEYWIRKYPGFILDVSYKDVVHDTDRQREKIEDFCHLSFDPERVSHEHNQAVITTPSGLGARQKIYASSIGRSEPYMKHLEPLLSALY